MVQAKWRESERASESEQKNKRSRSSRTHTQIAQSNPVPMLFHTSLILIGPFFFVVQKRSATKNKLG